MGTLCGLRAEVAKLKDINKLLLRRRLFRSIIRAERSEVIAFIDGIGIVTVSISFAQRYIGNTKRIPYFERVIEIPNAVVFTQERCAILYWFSTSKKFSRTEAGHRIPLEPKTAYRAQQKHPPIIENKRSDWEQSLGQFRPLLTDFYQT